MDPINSHKASSTKMSASQNNYHEDSIKIRVTREGKAYNRKVKVISDPPPQPIPIKTAQSAFTTQYNAQKNSMRLAQGAGILKSASRDPRQMKVQPTNIYTEKLPPLIVDKHFQSTGKKA